LRRATRFRAGRVTLAGGTRTPVATRIERIEFAQRRSAAVVAARAHRDARSPRRELELRLREQPGDLGVAREVRDRIVGVQIAAHLHERPGDLVREVVAVVVGGPGQRAQKRAHLLGEAPALGRVAGRRGGQGVHGEQRLADRVALPAAVELRGHARNDGERQSRDLAQRADQLEALEVLRAVARLIARVRRARREQALANVELDGGTRNAGTLGELGQSHAAEFDLGTWTCLVSQ